MYYAFHLFWGLVYVVNFVSYSLLENEKLFFYKYFYKFIGDLLLSWNKFKLDRPIFNLFSLVMPLNIDIFALSMRFWIFNKCNCTLIIVVDDNNNKGKIDIKIEGNKTADARK